jgi:hypothetical protein
MKTQFTKKSNPFENHSKTKKIKETPVNLLICATSDCLQHTTTTVHIFKSCIMYHLASDVSPHLRKAY